jgi:hypothetical protein
MIGYIFNSVFLIAGASLIGKVPTVRGNLKKYFVWHFAIKNKVPEWHFVKLKSTSLICYAIDYKSL